MKKFHFSFFFFFGAAPEEERRQSFPPRIYVYVLRVYATFRVSKIILSPVSFFTFIFLVRIF